MDQLQTALVDAFKEAGPNTSDTLPGDHAPPNTSTAAGAGTPLPPPPPGGGDTERTVTAYDEAVTNYDNALKNLGENEYVDPKIAGDMEKAIYDDLIRQRERKKEDANFRNRIEDRMGHMFNEGIVNIITGKREPMIWNRKADGYNDVNAYEEVRSTLVDAFRSDNSEQKEAATDIAEIFKILPKSLLETWNKDNSANTLATNDIIELKTILQNLINASNNLSDNAKEEIRVIFEN
jgi:hypothetical protein